MSEKDPIGVLVVEDHAVVREGLCALVSAWPGLKVAGEAKDGLEAVQKARTLEPDVILMDLVMPRMGGVEAIAEIVRENKEARILVLTSFSEMDKVASAISAGASGYLLKESTSQEVVQAIFDICQGRLVLHPSLTRSLIQKIGTPLESTAVSRPLTRREREILTLVARGLSNRGISEKLCISERTVARHVGNLLDKLGMENRTQAALYSLRTGMVDLDEDDLETQN